MVDKLICPRQINAADKHVFVIFDSALRTFNELPTMARQTERHFNKSHSQFYFLN